MSTTIKVSNKTLAKLMRMKADKVSEGILNVTYETIISELLKAKNEKGEVTA